MISYRFVPISSQKGVLFLRHPVDLANVQYYVSLNNEILFQRWHSHESGVMMTLKNNVS